MRSEFAAYRAIKEGLKAVSKKHISKKREKELKEMTAKRIAARPRTF